ncbi:fibronectin type III domain-containing protein [Pseudoalteromonas aurantia]|uniref:Fibronectin type-III domain-containing protein n=1 Tax=Pseudoalteromonas aurantia 208 TaxID=1314867 RepID=A0ABR9EBZ8_9GAMM|nr:fibronectin type III domain-containing protein [Pseudoalteromonas aurantia]MBE0367293.1 hypothetical protein [Pseudoalteromonas aurantia 208]
MFRVLTLSGFLLFSHIAFAIQSPSLNVSNTSIYAGDTIQLSWSKPASTAYFHLWVVKPGHGALAFRRNYTGTSFSRWIQNFPGTHTFYVEACDGKGACATSNSVGVRMSERTAPSAPTIVGPAYHEYRGTYSYWWNNPGGDVSSYQVEKSWKPDRTGNASVNTVTYSGTSYSETFTEPGTYVAKVRACNSVGCSGWSNNEVNIIRPHWKPNQTVANGPSSSSTGQFQLTWSKPWGHGINNYIVERAANGGGFGVVQSGASMSMHQSLSNGTYTYRINVCNEDNVCSDFGPTKQVVVDIPPPPPSAPSEPDVAWDLYHPQGGSIRVHVPSISGATSYTIYNDTTTSGRAKSINVGTGWTTVPAVGVGANYIRIAACNRSGCSESVPRRVVIFSAPHSVAPSIDKSIANKNDSVTISWGLPAGTIWSGAYFKVHCRTRAHGDVCNQTIPYQGSSKQTSFSHTFTASHVAGYDIQVLSCNESDSHCSTGGTGTVHVLPQVHGHPKFNLGHDFYYPINSDIPLILSSGIDGADSFAASVNGSIVKYLPGSGIGAIRIGTIGNHQLSMRACVTAPSGSRQCSADSASQKVVLFNHKPTAVTVELSNNTPGLGQATTLKWRAPSDMIWEKSYFKVHCVNGAGVDFCGKRINYRGDMPADFTESLTFNKHGTYSISVKACNKTTAYCSTSNTLQANLLPAVHGDPGYNVGWDFYYPLNSEIKVAIPQAIAGAESFALYYYKRDTAPVKIAQVPVTQSTYTIKADKLGKYTLQLASCVGVANPICSAPSMKRGIDVYTTPESVLPKLSKSQVRTSEKVTLTWTRPAGTIYESATYKVVCALEGDPVNHCLPEEPIRQIGKQTTHSYEFRLTKSGDYKIRVQSCNDAQHCSAQGYVALKVIQSDIPVPVVDAPTRTFLNAKERVKWAFSTPPKTSFDTTLFVKTPGSTERVKLASQTQNKAGEYTYSFDTAGTYHFYAQACGVVEDLKGIVPIVMNDIFIPITKNTRSSALCSELDASEVIVEVSNVEFLLTVKPNLLEWPQVIGATSYVVQIATCAQPCTDTSGLVWETLVTTNQGVLSHEYMAKQGDIFRVQACFSANDCTSWSGPTLYTSKIKKQGVIFIHTDLLGSPVAETQE